MESLRLYNRPSAVAIEDKKIAPVIDNSEGAIEALDTSWSSCDDESDGTVFTKTKKWIALRMSFLIGISSYTADWVFSTKTKKWIALWVSFVLGISFYTADWVFDIKLLIEYSTKGEWWYFGLTFVFVFVPAVLISWCIN